MDFDPRTDRLPFNDPDEAEQARAGATVPSHDARIRHLQRVPLFSGFNEDELRRVAELSRIAAAPAGTVVTQIGEPRSATIVATTDLRLLIVDRTHFWRLLDEAPDLVRRILMILSRRVRRLEQTVQTILRGTNPT